MTRNERRGITRRSFVKTLGAGVLVGLSAPLATACSGMDLALTGSHTVVDHAGRTLEIPGPGQLERIYFTSSVGHIYCFTMAPDKLGGTSMQFTPYELEYLPEGTADLEYLGSVSGGGEVNREALLVAGIQVIFDVSGQALTEAAVSEAQDLQDQTNIPVVVVDGSIENIRACYELLGECLGLPDRAAELADYCESSRDAVIAAVGDIPESEQVTLYYAEGPDGLQTEPDVTEHAYTFKVAGARNVADLPENANQGMSNVSLEQVLAWDPEVIIAWDLEVRGGADEEIRTNPNWSSIRAVRDGRVYTMPNTPFAWCDRPPGVQRFLGIQWVANMLYPERYAVDMREVVREFYEKFFWVNVTDEQIAELLGNSYPPVSRVTA